MDWIATEQGALHGPQAGAQRVAFRCSAIYVAAALAWIFLSDLLVDRFAAGTPSQLWLAVGKGFAFVFVTGVVLYLALARLLRRLSKARWQWHQAIDAIPDAVWVASADRQRLLYLNRAARAGFAEPLGRLRRAPQDWPDLVHEADRKSVRDAWCAPDFAVPRQVTFRLQEDAGAERWLRCHFGPLHDDAGEVFAVAGVATDVTQEVVARRHEQDARSRLHAIIDSAMDAIVSVDAGQRVRVFNRAAAATFGVAAEDALGQPLDRFLPATARTAHRRQVEAFLNDGSTSRSMTRAGQLTALRADGSEFPIEATISRSCGEGEPALTVILRDVTDRERAQQADRRRVEAEAKDQAKSEFLSRMSHELRTPLNAVIGFSELMLDERDAVLPPPQAERLRHVREAAWHLLAIINDVLDLSRVEANRMTLQIGTLDLGEAAGEAMSMCQEMARRYAVTLFGPLHDGDRVWVRADPVRLRQVLINLVSNAIKYNTREGGVIVNVGRDTASGFVRVVDSGEGMTPEQLTHLFEPFNRLGREASGIEGTGIGLVLSRQLVQLMAGRLQLRSTPGQGTEASIGLPLAAHAPPPAPPALQQAPATPWDPDAPALTGTLLYIEDNPVNAVLVEEFLKHLGEVRFLHADRGAAGVDLAAAAVPDLILVDLHLPDMNGLEVIRRLRAAPALREVPIFVLSADVRSGLAEAAADAGADDFYAKPIDFALLARGLRRRLGPAAG